MNYGAKTVCTLAAAATLTLTAISAQATSIVAIKTGNDIFIGADSKVLLEKGVGFSQCKITKMSDAYIVFSGIPSVPTAKFNAYDLAEKAFAGKGSISERLTVFDKSVSGKLQEAFEKIRTTDDKLFSQWYTPDVKNRVAMQILVAGPEGKGTTLSMIEYRIDSKKSEPVKIVSTRENIVTKPGSDQPKILFIGMQDAIRALMKKKDFFSDFDEVRNINEWIKAEAIADPSKVSEPVDIVKISPKKAQWIQHKSQCPEIEETPVKVAPKK